MATVTQCRIFYVFKFFQEDYPNFKKQAEPIIPIDSMKLVISAISERDRAYSYAFIGNCIDRKIITKIGNELTFNKEIYKTFLTTILEEEKKY